MNHFGSSPAARPIAREVMQISHNFCEFCITCPPKPRPMGHRHLFNVSGSWPCCAQLNGPVCHFPSWPCRPCRPTIARRAFNCHPCNRSAARWHLQRPNKRPNLRLSCPMSCAVPWPKLRSIKPLRTVGRVPTIWLKPGEVCAVSPKLRKVMTHFHNFGPQVITPAANRWILLAAPFRHPVASSVSVYGQTPYLWGMLPATLPARLPRWPRPQLFPNTACHVMVFNADSALPMLNQHCFSRPHCVRRRRSSCKNHIPNLKITFLTAPDRVERPVKSNAMPPGNGSDPTKWVNDPFPATIQCSPHIGNVRQTLAPGFRPRPHPAYSPSQSRSPATYGSPSYFMGPAHQTPLCCRPEMPA